MSLDKCLAPLLAEGKIDQETHDQASGLFAELQQDLRRQFGDQAADAMASDATLKALETAAVRKRFLAGRTIATRQRIEMDLGGYNGGAGGGRGGAGGPIDPRSGPALFDGDDRAPYSNVDGRRRAVIARAHAKNDELLARHSANLLGNVRDKAGLVDITRELFGEDSGNANARELADAWTQTAEMLRQRFNAAGGDVGKLERWGLPQSHDARTVRAAGFEAWRAEILPRLDRARMIDERTGLAMSDAALEDQLVKSFERIRSEGWSDRNPGTAGAGSLANRRGDPRFFVFKSAADWLAYSEKFGGGTAFDAMMGHIDGMARDIALMEVLGPNPSATVDWLKGSIEQSAALDQAPDSKATDRAHASVKKIDRLYGEITGSSHRPENRQLALVFSSLRSLQTAAKLGGAVLSAISDTAFQLATRKFNGLSGATMLRDYAKLMRPGALEDQKLAVRSGLIAEEWSHRTAAQHRFMGEELTGEVSRRLAEGVLRASGLSRWTQAGRWAFGMEMLGAMTDTRGLRFSELDPGFRGMFERNGISAADWDAIRTTPLELDRGTQWLRPHNVADQVLGDRLLEMIARETDLAVPVPDLNTRSIINSVAPRGTWHGEIIKSAFLFKSFGISVLLQHGGRMMAMAGPKAARYATGLVIGTTLMGALSLFLKDVVAGRDPRSANDTPFYNELTGEKELNPGFWGQAMAQGGGFGIFGDFIKSGSNRFGGGMMQTMAGPMADDVQGLFNVATSKNKAGAALKEAKGLLPGGNLWYTRLAFDRLLADQLQEAVDPDYRKSWDRMDKFAREQGSGVWWAPGETAPERAPELNNITAEQGNNRP